MNDTQLFILFSASSCCILVIAIAVLLVLGVIPGLNNRSNTSDDEDEEDDVPTTRRPATTSRTGTGTTTPTTIRAPVPISSIDETKYYYICNKWNKCLSSRPNSVENNQEVIQSTRSNEKGQKWRLKKDGSLCNENNMCIFSSDNSEFDGSIIRQYGGISDQDGAKWSVNSDGNVCNKFNKCLAPRANAGADGTDIIQWSPSQENGQLWSFYNV